MGLAEHGEWATNTGSDPGPRKMNTVIEALDEEDREILLGWLRDPKWPSNRIARAVRRMGQAEAIKECLQINHNNVASWRASNNIKMPDAHGS